MDVQTYLYFDGCCQQAIDFYVDAFGAELLFVMRYEDAPKELIPPGGEEQIFHCTIKLGDTLLNLSDYTAGADRSSFAGFALLVHLETVAEAEEVSTALQVGGKVLLPLGSTPWAQLYGIIRDKFGVTWKLQVNN